jgi:hypothetical protein
MKSNIRVGVVGYCPPTRFDEQKAKEYLTEAYNQIEKDFPNARITIVSGLTNVGVLKLAYEEAKRRHWSTAGVACKKAYDFEWFKTDEQPIIIGDNWGDETDTFVKSIDALVRIGLGKQSLLESELVRKRGSKTYEYDLPSIK